MPTDTTKVHYAPHSVFIRVFRGAAISWDKLRMRVICYTVSGINHSHETICINFTLLFVKGTEVALVVDSYEGVVKIEFSREYLRINLFEFIIAEVQMNQCCIRSNCCTPSPSIMPNRVKLLSSDIFLLFFFNREVLGSNCIPAQIKYFQNCILLKCRCYFITRFGIYFVP